MSEFGLVHPVIARRDDGEVIGGYQRLDAAQEGGGPPSISTNYGIISFAAARCIGNHSRWPP